MKLLNLLLLAWIPLLSYAQWGDAKWIGTDVPTVYAPYLPQFRICWSIQLDQDSHSTTAAVLFGGNDPRLMDRNMNILDVENGQDESYIKVQLSADKHFLSVWRINYTAKDRRRGAPASSAEELLANFGCEMADIYATHEIAVACCLGTATLSFDGNELGRVELNPMGTGGDYICFPQLADIGYEMEAGQRATLWRTTVRNSRSPCHVLYEEATPVPIGMANKPVRMLTTPRRGSMPLLRRHFAIKDKRVSQATLTATARGIYHASINGQRVGNEYYAPGISQYNKTHYYQTYDVTPLLQSSNTLDVSLAEGWWAGGMTYSGGNWNYFGDQLAFIGRLLIRYADGDSTVITTQPGQWQVCSNSKVQYASMFQGEVYDNTAGVDSWQGAKEMTLEGHLPTEGGGTTPKVDDYSFFQLLPSTTSVGLFTTLTAQGVNEVRPHVYIYDMGQNMAGIPKITLTGLHKGQRLTFRYAEVLYPDLPAYSGKAGTMMLENIRAAMAQDIYIAHGDTSEEFIPEQTLHGYRYVEITGIDHPLPLDAVKGLVLSSIQQFTADFECSNPLVNRLWKNIQWSMLSNFISMPTDCPQRNERMGWSGDISVFSRTAVMMAQVDSFLRKHLQAMRDVQTAEGRMPDIAPIGGGFGGLLWGSAGITVPWECWLQYADRQLLAEHYDAMRAYIHYVDAHYFDRETGLLVQERQWGDLGDWLGLEDSRNDKTLLFEAYYIYDLDIMRQTALLLGKYDDAERYAKRLAERKLFFIDNYVDKATGTTIVSAAYAERKGQAIDTQGSYVLPLAFHIVEGDLRRKMTERLVATIQRENVTDQGVRCPPYSLMTGFITTAWISRVLSDNQRSDVAYRLLQQQDYPSWLYPVTQGATTIWERLNSYTHTAGFGGNNAMNSFNHYSFGAVGQWLVNRCLGIERDERQPGYRHFFLRPEADTTGQMTYAKGHLDTPYGRIESRWTVKSDGTVAYAFVIPEGTTATLLLPGKAPRELSAGRHELP